VHQNATESVKQFLSRVDHLFAEDVLFSVHPKVRECLKSKQLTFLSWVQNLS